MEEQGKWRAVESCFVISKAKRGVIKKKLKNNKDLIKRLIDKKKFLNKNVEFSKKGSTNLGLS